MIQCKPLRRSTLKHPDSKLWSRAHESLPGFKEMAEEAMANLGLEVMAAGCSKAAIGAGM